jgi:hypothetical protein
MRMAFKILRQSAGFDDARTGIRGYFFGDKKTRE